MSKIPNEQWGVVKELFLSDPHKNTARKIAQDFGVGEGQILAVLHAQGIYARDFQKGRRHPNAKFSLIADDILSLYRDGASLATISREFGCSQGTVSKLAKRAGISRPRGGGKKHYPSEFMEKVQELYQSGLSQEDVAGLLGTHQTTISKLLIDMGCPIRKTGVKRGEEHPAWKGGRVRYGKNNEYVKVMIPPDHPMAAMRDNVGYIPEHRLVMAEALGRPLQYWETVHHLGKEDDNRLEMLQLRFGSHGRGQAFVCGDCGSHNVLPEKLRDT